jgi:hypothetical protein
MSALEEVRLLLEKHKYPPQMLGAIRAEVLREVADLLERGLVREPCGEAEEHLNNCYQDDIRRLRRMAKEATS